MANSVLWENFDGFPVKALQYHNIPWITKGAVDFLDSARAEKDPFFLYLAPTAIHGPNHYDNLSHDQRYTIAGFDPEVINFQPDPAQLKATASTYPNSEQHRFAGIAQIDHQVGHILDYLEANGMMENTAIVFMADHNIEPGKATCYQKGTNVPLIIKWPEVMPGQVNETSLAQNTDLLPTFLEAAGDSSYSTHKDGVSIAPILTGKKKQTRDFVFAEAGYARSISDGSYKYIALRFPSEVTAKMKNGALLAAPNYLNTPKQAHSRIAINYFPDYFDANQFYDLSKDPYEQTNMASKPLKNPDYQRLVGALEKHLSSFAHPFHLADSAVYQSQEYRKLAVDTQEKNQLDDIVWWKRDHGNLQWPPESAVE